MWEVDIGLHGWIALTLTVVGVAVLNVGLMRLARRRWDHEFQRLETAEPDEVIGPDRQNGRDPGMSPGPEVPIREEAAGRRSDESVSPIKPRSERGESR